MNEVGPVDVMSHQFTCLDHSSIFVQILMKLNLQHFASFCFQWTRGRNVLLWGRKWFLDYIVANDETWVHHITPEFKCDSMIWKHTSSPCVRNFKQTLLLKKVIACVFWDWQNVLSVEFIPHGQKWYARNDLQWTIIIFGHVLVKWIYIG